MNISFSLENAYLSTTNQNTSTAMNLRVNSNILPMASPRVMYAMENEIFFLHSATLYLSPGETDVEKNEYGNLDTSRALQRVATDTVCYPIDEEGIVRDDCCDFEDCIPVGRAGDSVSNFHPAILESLKTDNSASYPQSYAWAKKCLEKYGIQVKEERREKLRFDIFLKSYDSDSHHQFEAHCYQGESDIPFLKRFRKEEYSDEMLAAAIASTLKGYFKVYPVPDEVQLSVPGVNPGEEENAYVKQMVATSLEQLCKIV